MTYFVFPSKASEFLGGFSSPVSMDLTPKEKEELTKFEQDLFAELQTIMSIEVKTHMIYPEAFASNEGSKLFGEVYGIQEEGSFAAEEEIEKIFLEVDLGKISQEKRIKAHLFSESWARDFLACQMIRIGGVANKLPNLKRLWRVVNEKVLLEKIDGLIRFGAKISRMVSERRDQEIENEAELIILDIYARFVEVEKNKWLRLWVPCFVKGQELMEWLSFLDKTENGVDSVSKSQITPRLVAMVEKIEEGKNVSVTPYEGVWVNAQQAKMLAERVLAEYGFDDWKVVIRKGEKSSLGVMVSKKEVRIPKNFHRGLVDTLVVLAHEIEGHVLKTLNGGSDWELAIMKNYSAGGRDDVLSEAGGKWVENRTRELIVGESNPPKPYYLRMMQIRLKGGSFRDCFAYLFWAYARELGVQDVVLGDEKTFDKVFDYSYDRAMRLFEGQVPLDDASGLLTDSSQLKYLEQEIVAEELGKAGLLKVLFVKGVDIFSIQQLLRLGVVDLSLVWEPRLVVGRKLWQMIKEGLEKGKSLDEILI